MQKHFKFKYLLYGILAIYVLSWLIWGRSNTLLLAAEEFRTAGTEYVDTIHVFLGNDSSDPWYYSRDLNFSEKTRSRYFALLEQKASVVKVYSGSFEEERNLLPEYLDYENAVYSVRVLRVVPFFAFIDMATLAGGGSATHEGYYIWVFHWRKIVVRQTSVS